MRLVPLAVLALTLAAAPRAGTIQNQSAGTTPTAAISGVVVDGLTQKPVAAAMVQISAAPIAAPVLTVRAIAAGPAFRATRQITDELGRFVFADLPGGASYTLTAIKSGYFDGAYGRRGFSGINNAPRRITLANGQWMRDVRIEVLRPATIAGTIRDQSGEPMVGVTVRAYADLYIGGVRQLAASLSATTDDRGEYRLASLAPGRYVVAVPSTQHSAPADMLAAPAAITRDALSREQGGRPYPRFALDPIHRLTLTEDSPPPAPAAGGIRQVYPLTFHPSARAISETTPIEVGSGDEKTSIDVQLRPVPGFRVSGRLDGPAEAVARMTLRLMAAGTETLGRGIEQATALVANDGTFTFLNVPGGGYTLIASRVISQYSYMGGGIGPDAPGTGRSAMASMPAYAAPPGTMLLQLSAAGSQKYQGRQTVVVAGHDVTDVVVPLQTGVSMSGRIVYDTSNPDFNMPVPLISAEPISGDLSLGRPRSIRDIDDDPTYFYIEGIMPGSYLLRTVNVGTLKSVTWADKDYTDTPLEVAGLRNITGVVITVTDRLPTIGGTIRDRAGQPTANAGIVFFPADRALWRNFGNQPTRIRYLAGSTTGTYSLRGLPAGDYLAIGVDDSNADRWQDPAFFEIAARTAIRFSVDWGESKTVDVTVQEVR